MAKRSAGPIVEVQRKSSLVIGQMYFKTATHIVLLNNVLQEADLGRRRQRHVRHFDAEADVTVIPRSEVVRVEVLGEAE